MTDKLVDSDLNNLGEIDTSNLTTQLEAEKTTSNNEESIATAESVAEQSAPETTVPPKFQGKSVDEILESYSNLEKQYGKQGNELGELRKLADTLIQKNLQESQNNIAQTHEEALSDDDFLINPIESVRRIVEESLQPIKGALNQTAADTTISRLQAKHPDLESVVQDIDFQKWVMESVPRQDMWQRASAGDFNYADELLTQYKSLYSVKQEAVQQKVQTEKEKELQAATAVASGASPDAVSTSKPTYRRTELIRLQLEDPKRYADLQPEIYQAYSEGRVR